MLLVAQGQPPAADLGMEIDGINELVILSWNRMHVRVDLHELINTYKQFPFHLNGKTLFDRALAYELFEIVNNC